MMKTEDTALEKTDVFFYISSLLGSDFPTIQYLRFSENGWLLEAVNIYATGKAEIKEASESWPLSVTPLDLENLEETWESGRTCRCFREEFVAVKALVLQHLS